MVLSLTGEAAPTVLVIPSTSKTSLREQTLTQEIEGSLSHRPDLTLLPFASFLNETPGRCTLEPSLALMRESFLQQNFAAMLKELHRLEGEQPEQVIRCDGAAMVNLLGGVAYTSLGQTGAATDRFRLALSLDAQASLDPALYAPSLVAGLQQVKEASGVQETFPLTLQITPVGQVTLDGKPLGLSSLIRHVTPGFHYLSVARTGYRDLHRILDIRQALTLKATLALQDVPGTRRQIAELLRQGTFDPGDRDHWRILTVAGVSHLISWRWQEDGSIQATLHQTATGSVQRSVILPRALINQLWARLNQPAPRVAKKQQRIVPWWNRWWVWGLVGTAVGGTIIGIATWQSQDPTVQVHIR